MNWRVISLSKLSIFCLELILLSSTISAKYYSADNDVIIDRSAYGLAITIIAGRINCGSFQCPAGTERCVITERSNVFESKIFTERTCLDHEGNVRANITNFYPNPTGKPVKRVSTATLYSGVQQCNNCDGLSSILNMKPSDVHVQQHHRRRPTAARHHFNNENINNDNMMFENNIPSIPEIPAMSFPDATNIGIHSSSGVVSQRSTIVTPLGIEEKHHTAHIRREHKTPTRHVQRTQTHDRARQSFFEHTSTSGNSNIQFSNMNSIFPNAPHITVHHRQTIDIDDPRRIRDRLRTHFDW